MSANTDIRSRLLSDLIRRDQDRSGKLQALQEAITKGLQSGEPEAFDF